MSVEQLIMLRRDESRPLVRPAHTTHQEFTAQVARVLEDFLARSGVPVEAVAHRTKTRESFLAKCLKPSVEDPDAFKYSQPWEQITDVSGVRVTTLLLDTVPLIEGVIRDKFVTKGRELRTGVDDPTVPGYLSVHYLIELPDHHLDCPVTRLSAASRRRSRSGRSCSTPGRRSSTTSSTRRRADPRSPAVERRLRGLAGMLELADKEFDAIRDELEQAREAAADELELELNLRGRPRPRRAGPSHLPREALSESGVASTVWTRRDDDPADAARDHQPVPPCRSVDSASEHAAAVRAELEQTATSRPPSSCSTACSGWLWQRVPRPATASRRQRGRRGEESCR
jgi:ppGpp synthetase/RelA/SpoT-type nucleotidyltranferase